MNKRMTLCAVLLVLTVVSGRAQFGKLKGLVGKKDSTKTEAKNDEKKEEKKEEKKGGPGLFSKLVTKIASASGSMMTSKVSTLDNVVPNVYYQTNLHPSAVGTVAQAFYEGWKGGGNMVGIMFTTKNSFGFNKLDGEVRINGQLANYASMGLYTVFAEDNGSPKKVEITTASGQKSTFTLVPPKQSVRVRSINGQQNNVSVDFSKDVVVELDCQPAGDQTPVLVKVAATALGLKTFYEVGYFAPTNKLTIPAAFFRNMNVAPGNVSVLSFKNSYLEFERATIENVSGLSGTFPSVQYGNMYDDGKLVTGIAEPDINRGITLKGKEKQPSGEFEYLVYKPNAYISRPFNQAKTVALTSLVIRGTTSYYSKDDNKLTGIETTKEARFPQIPDSEWDIVLGKIYQDISAILGSELGAKMLPVESVTGAKAYQDLVPFAKDDVNNTVEFSRSYKNTRLLSAFIPISEGYGINDHENRLMDETGADALLKVTVDLNISYGGSRPMMTPKLALELSGRRHGPTMSTKYVVVNLTAPGATWKKDEMVTNSSLDQKWVRRDELVAVLKSMLAQIKAKEAQNPDYGTVWANQ